MRFSRIRGHLISNAITQSLNIATGLIIIALLPFEQMALYAIVMLVSGPLGLLGSLRLEWILMNTKSNFAATQTARAGIFAAALTAPVAVTLMIGFQTLGWFNFEMPTYIQFLSGTVFCFTFAAQRIVGAYHLTRNSIRNNVRLRMFHAAARFIFSAILCIVTKRAEAVFVAEIMASVVFFLLCGERQVFSGLFRGVRIRWVWLWRHHRKMLLSSTPSAVVTSVAANIVPVIMISAVSVEAGGITYAVQRLAGVPVKFALLTVGEVWHKMVRRGDLAAVRFASDPKLLFLGMSGVFILMLIAVNGGVFLAYFVEANVAQNAKLLTMISAVQAYQLFFAISLSVNLFNRVLVMREIIHRKLFSDVVFLLAPLALFFWPIFIDQPLQVISGIAALSILQSTAYCIMAAFILSEARVWQREHLA